jgi:hypothetical protein
MKQLLFQEILYAVNRESKIYLIMGEEVEVAVLFARCCVVGNQMLG